MVNLSSKALGPALLLATALAFTAGCPGEDTTPAEPAVPGDTAAPVPPSPTGAPTVDASDVGLPVFPGLQQAGRSEGGDEISEGMVALPSIVGHTEAAMDEVVAFYAERLGDWNRLEAHGMHVFWKGDSDAGFDPASPEAMTRPSVSVMPPIRDGMPVRVQYVYER